MPLTRPTTTPLPDEIYDVWAPQLGEAELKVLLYIVRRTLGFRKEADAISLSQFLHGLVTRDGRVLDHGCGVKSRRTLVAALKALEDKDLIQATRGRASQGHHTVTIYALRWEGDTGLATQDGGSSRRIPPSSPRIPGWCSQDTVVVAQEHHGSSLGLPTTNSTPTNRQHNSETTRAGARGASAPRYSGDDPLSDGAAVWHSVLQEVQELMTRENYTRWLAGTSAVASTDGTLVVSVPTMGHQHWLDTRLRRRVEQALRIVGALDLTVTFQVAP